jgi:transposase
MMNVTFPALGWEGFFPVSITPLSSAEQLITLAADPAVLARCGRCDRVCHQIHDVTRRRVRDRDLFEYRVWLEIPLRRTRCPDCGVSREKLSWLEQHARYTERLRLHVEVLASLLPIKHVAALTGLHWHTIKSIDKANLVRSLPPPDLSCVRFLVMDEFALFKGHRYAGVVIDAQNKRVLWVGEGRSRASIRPFFEWLGVHCQRIEAVAMDMNTAMDLEVQACCPQARVIYDLFHVVAKFGREVVDRVRVDQANRLREDRPARRAVKRSRWLLLRNRDHLSTDQAGQLDELLHLNQPLMVVYLMKEQLKELWYAPSEQEAIGRWHGWWNQAMNSGLVPLMRFARRLKPYLEGIVASATYRLHTSVLEGINNRIKVIKRMAYGYRDQEYFFLKIKAAFPGKAR